MLPQEALAVFAWAHTNAFALFGFMLAGLFGIGLTALYYDAGPR